MFTHTHRKHDILMHLQTHEHMCSYKTHTHAQIYTLRTERRILGRSLRILSIMLGKSYEAPGQLTSAVGKQRQTWCLLSLFTQSETPCMVPPTQGSVFTTLLNISGNNFLIHAELFARDSKSSPAR